jgi:hypothetical protein
MSSAVKIYDTVGGPTLDASFLAVQRSGRVVSSLGWGTHSLAPLSFRAAIYSGVFTLLPLLTGEGRAHHVDILKEARLLVEEGKLTPCVDPPRVFAGVGHGGVPCNPAEERAREDCRGDLTYHWTGYLPHRAKDGREFLCAGSAHSFGAWPSALGEEVKAGDCSHIVSELSLRDPE